MSSPMTVRWGHISVRMLANASEVAPTTALLPFRRFQWLYGHPDQWADIVEFGETIKNPAYRILQTEYSGCLDISAHA